MSIVPTAAARMVWHLQPHNSSKVWAATIIHFFLSVSIFLYLSYQVFFKQLQDEWLCWWEASLCASIHGLSKGRPEYLNKQIIICWFGWFCMAWKSWGWSEFIFGPVSYSTVWSVLLMMIPSYCKYNYSMSVNYVKVQSWLDYETVGLWAQTWKRPRHL